MGKGDNLHDPLGVDSLADGSPGGGAPLPGGLRARMETSFGADFSGVRVHQDARPAAFGARALTRGQDLHFQPGLYDPDGLGGQRLIGHELAHVVQQQGGVAQAQGKDAAIDADPGLEAEADAAGDRAAAGQEASVGRGGARGGGAGWGGAAPIQCKRKAGAVPGEVADFTETLGQGLDLPGQGLDTVFSPMQAISEQVNPDSSLSKGLGTTNNAIGGVGAGVSLLGAFSSGSKMLAEYNNKQNATTVAGKHFANREFQKAGLDMAVQAAGGGLGIGGLAGPASAAPVIGAVGSGLDALYSGAKAIDASKDAVKTRAGSGAGRAITQHKQSILDQKIVHDETAPVLDNKQRAARENYLSAKYKDTSWLHPWKKKRIGRELNTLKDFENRAMSGDQLVKEQEKLALLQKEQKEANAKVPWYKRMVGIGTNKNKGAINASKLAIQNARDAKEAQYGVAKTAALGSKNNDDLAAFESEWGGVRDARRLNRVRGTLHEKASKRAVAYGANAAGGGLDAGGGLGGAAGIPFMAAGKGIKATVAGVGLGSRLANRWGRARDLEKAEEMMDPARKASKWGAFKNFIKPWSKMDDRRGDIAKDARRALEERAGGSVPATRQPSTLAGSDKTHADLDKIYKLTATKEDRHTKQFTDMLVSGKAPDPSQDPVYGPETPREQLQATARTLASADGMGPNGAMKKKLAGKTAAEKELELREQWYGARDKRNGSDKATNIMKEMMGVRMQVF